ncbi:hypothetical protein RSOLAG1IB_11856 [Rhizoctonia solani AG-1 IB]|uniref:Uncharacterized protein n=1 Tax=Thanatephorus cucumeris (strain AG1-IB / isolate 7/3/14) TaxID=1108050 RepID=A0A0B7FIV4_THACB|nr:hypothetical protein RSOLAG1IB_11856 [Rhizoctonia solani AG-1 IB]
MNKISAVIPKIPQDSKVSKTISNYQITLLSGYNSLSHPLTSYVGEDCFRKANGGRNNLNRPDFGCAWTTYKLNVHMSKDYTKYTASRETY